jgi:hypothetical protein
MADTSFIALNMAAHADRAKVEITPSEEAGRAQSSL